MMTVADRFTLTDFNIEAVLLVLLNDIREFNSEITQFF